MTWEEYDKIIAEVESLPSGGITYKKINGKEYAYYQWREDGKQRSRRAKDEELEELSRKIEYRKALRSLIREAGCGYNAKPKNETQFRCVIRLGEDLARFVKPVEKWAKRECYTSLYNYVYGDIYDRVYILYGLRRTGKTTLIRQLISEMDADIYL